MLHYCCLCGHICVKAKLGLWIMDITWEPSYAYEVKGQIQGQMSSEVKFKIAQRYFPRQTVGIRPVSFNLAFFLIFVNYVA